MRNCVSQPIRGKTESGRLEPDAKALHQSHVGDNIVQQNYHPIEKEEVNE